MDPFDAERALDLPIDELTALVRGDDHGWARLREHADREAALELFGLRMQSMLMEDEVDRAVAEISSDQVKQDAAADPVLANVLASVELVAGWREHAAWRRVRAEGAVPDALRRFLELFPSMGHAYRRPLVDALGKALGEERVACLRALDRMQAADPELVGVLDRATRGLVPGEGLAWTDLDERERAYVAEAMQRIAGRLVKAEGPRRWPRYAVGGSVGGLAWLAIGGYTGLLIGTGVVVIVLVDTALKGLGDYMHATRERVADAVVETGLSPDRMLEWLHRQQTGPVPVNQLGFEAGFAEDRVLHTLARLARVCLRGREDLG